VAQLSTLGGKPRTIPKTMKIIQTLLASFVLILFTGCVSPCCHSFTTQLSHLQQGMTKDQVVLLLGTPSDAGTGTHHEGPNSTINDGFSEVFRYTRTCHGQAKDWIIVFVHGKVSEYGPYVGDLQLRYGGVFLNR
jgi:hypothetical protein